jgi:hypothetical protein
MNRLLEIISWKFRRHNLNIVPFQIEWSGRDSSFVIFVIKVVYNLKTYSLVEIHLAFPNKTTTQKFYLYSWDFFFLHNYVSKLYCELEDRNTWNRNSLSTWDKFRLKILNKII